MEIVGGDSNTVSKYRGVQKLETVSLAELNDYIFNSVPQAIDFLCTRKVTGIQAKNGWCYISCSKCSKKLQRGPSTFTCTLCNNSNAVGVVRHRVEMRVSDNKDEALLTDMYDKNETSVLQMWAISGDLVWKGWRKAHSHRSSKT